jgi:hypothetical protein
LNGLLPIFINLLQIGRVPCRNIILTLWALMFVGLMDLHAFVVVVEDPFLPLQFGN